MELQEKMEALVRALSRLRIPLTESEYQLHELIAAALCGGGFAIRHEAVLSPRCRIDFLADGIGIEVKRGKPDKNKLRAQCERYLESPQLEALILVVDTRVTLPNRLCGKPVMVVGLNRLWGVALP